MNIFPLSSSCRNCFLSLILLSYTGFSASGPLTPDMIESKTVKTVIVSEVLEHEENVFAFVRNKEDTDLYTAFAPHEIGKKVSKEMAEDVLYIGHIDSSIFHELFKKELQEKTFVDTKEREEELEEAIEEARSKILKNEQAELEKAGIKYDPDSQYICYYYEGKALFKVTYALKGKLKTNDEISVHYKELLRVSCPPLRPILDAQFCWTFSEDLKNGDTTRLGHGYSNTEEIIKLSQK